MVTRSRATKKPVAQVVEDITPKDASYKDRLHAAVEDMFNSTRPEITWVRRTVAWLCSFAAAFGVGYLIGTIMNYAIVGMAILSTNMFLMLVCWALGAILAMYIGSKAASILYSGVVDQTIENAVCGAYSSVKSWFTPTPKVAAA